MNMGGNELLVREFAGRGEEFRRLKKTGGVMNKGKRSRDVVCMTNAFQRCRKRLRFSVHICVRKSLGVHAPFPDLTNSNGDRSIDSRTRERE